MKVKSFSIYTIISMYLLISTVSAAETQVGNKICPVSKETIGSMGPGATVTYQGKVYNLCCDMCIKDFEMDPAKYVKLVESQREHSGHTASLEGHNLVQEASATPSPAATPAGEISHYTCGMHPSVKVSVENYKKGDTKCPICFMPLTPVKLSGSSRSPMSKNAISQVDIAMDELKLAGVETEPVIRQPLFKEIRVVGRVAYDPQLAIAQDEFISAVQSYEKAKSGQVPEIISRAEALVESSRRKLQLLGLNIEQIKELEQTREVQAGLILPGEKMWLYGDVYEYELNWIKEGSHIKAVPVGMAGEEFYGEIVSINPVVDPQTRSVRFRAMVDNPNQRLRPEMYVDIEIMSQYEDPQGRTKVLSIPKGSLLDTGRRKIVWVDLGEGRFEGRKVEVGPEAINHSDNPQRYYPVLSGLEEGEKVVTKGSFMIDSQSQITGVAASAFGGALGEDQKRQPSAPPAGHVH